MIVNHFLELVVVQLINKPQNRIIINKHQEIPWLDLKRSQLNSRPWLTLNFLPNVSLLVFR